MKISKSLFKQAAEAPVLSAEDIASGEKKAAEIATRLGVEIPEVIGLDDTDDEAAKKMAKNAAISAKALSSK